MTTFTTIEESRANVADGSPSGCSLCGATNGPFVLVDQIAQNPVGPVKLDRQIQLCAPKYENGAALRQGCAGSLAIQLGFVPSEVLTQAQQQLHDAYEQHAELEQRIAVLKDSQLLVVPVDELMKLIDAAKPAGA